MRDILFSSFLESCRFFNFISFPSKMPYSTRNHLSWDLHEKYYYKEILKMKIISSNLENSSLSLSFLCSKSDFFPYEKERRSEVEEDRCWKIREKNSFCFFLHWKKLRKVFYKSEQRSLSLDLTGNIAKILFSSKHTTIIMVW
jgi:hypothetical protein